MVDGSTASLEENIAFTKQITTIAKENGVYTEAEVGHVARVGTENSEGSLATVADCVRLTSETGVDSLAAAVGTAHGIYQTLPKIDFQRIREIHNAVKIPWSFTAAPAFLMRRFRERSSVASLKSISALN